jgi:hypothetical protein
MRGGRSVSRASGTPATVTNTVAHMGVWKRSLILPNQGKNKWVRAMEHTMRATPITPTNTPVTILQ